MLHKESPKVAKNFKQIDFAEENNIKRSKETF